MSIKLAMELYFSAKEWGGGSFWRSGDPILNKEGYVVGGFVPSLELRPGNVIDDVEKIAEWLDNNYSVSYGSWVDDGVYYFDAIDIYNSLDVALEVARENKQLAIWSLSNESEIRLEKSKEDGG
jgi:hypothetical protein